jgi:hypothetical protein
MYFLSTFFELYVNFLVTLSFRDPGIKARLCQNLPGRVVKGACLLYSSNKAILKIRLVLGMAKEVSWPGSR